jgi:phosphomevalonate kinase
VKVVAPGKLLLTGAYAVLEGAPAIVVAVDRYATADTSSPDDVDVRPLHDAAGRKLGLGSSSAALVASLAARAVAEGRDPTHAAVRASLFRAARQAHARSQGGGSGVDVAAAVHGGALCYVVGPSQAFIRTVELPDHLVWAAFWSGTSARTSDLLGRVRALRSRDASTLQTLEEIASRAAESIEARDVHGFVAAARDYGRGLAALGHAAGVPIVPPAFAELAALADDERAAFLPSGAGGGDVAVWLSSAPPSDAFRARAELLSMRPLALGLDLGGVRLQSPS